MMNAVSERSRSEAEGTRSAVTASNMITALRFPLAALFPFVGGGARIAVVVAAAISDLVDGRLARRMGAVDKADDQVEGGLW